MKNTFLLLSCLLSITLLQAELFSTECGRCGGKKKNNHKIQIVRDVLFNSCDCGCRGANGSNDIPLPPPNNE